MTRVWHVCSGLLPSYWLLGLGQATSCPRAAQLSVTRGMEGLESAQEPCTAQWMLSGLRREWTAAESSQCFSPPRALTEILLRASVPGLEGCWSPVGNADMLLVRSTAQLVFHGLSQNRRVSTNRSWACSSSSLLSWNPFFLLQFLWFPANCVLFFPERINKCGVILVIKAPIVS